MRRIAARFYGGPWNAETRTVEERLVIRAEVFDNDDEEDLTPPRVGTYRQGERRSGVVRYDWEGWI